MSTTMTDPDEEWNAFVAGHRQQLEDALLPTLAEAQEVGIIPDPAKQLVAKYDEMLRTAKVRGVTLTYPDGGPPAGTEMKVMQITSPVDGGQVDIPIPANVPAKGIRISINGIEAILFPDPDPEAEATVDDEDEVEAAITKALDIRAQAVGRNGGGDVIYGITVSEHLRTELIEAWSHYEDHACQAAAAMLDRIIEQLIVAMRLVG